MAWGAPKAPILVPKTPKDILTNIGRQIQWLRWISKK